MIDGCFYFAHPSPYFAPLPPRSVYDSAKLSIAFFSAAIFSVDPLIGRAKQPGNQTPVCTYELSGCTGGS